MWKYQRSRDLRPHPTTAQIEQPLLSIEGVKDWGACEKNINEAGMRCFLWITRVKTPAVRVISHFLRRSFQMLQYSGAEVQRLLPCSTVNSTALQPFLFIARGWIIKTEFARTSAFFPRRFFFFKKKSSPVSALHIIVKVVTCQYTIGFLNTKEDHCTT